MGVVKTITYKKKKEYINQKNGEKEKECKK